MFKMKSLFCTNSTIGYGSGGGVVTYHIRLALTELPSELQWFDNQCGQYDKIEPHAIDHFICEKLNGTFDLAVFYGAPFGLVAKKVKPAKIVSDVAPHNIELSREEHKLLGTPFNYGRHLTDWNEWHRYMLHVVLADLVIVHSHFSGEYIRKNLKLTNRIEVLPHGCDPPDVVPPYPDQFVIGHLSVNAPDKGQIYLLQAIKKLGPLKNAGFAYAGLNTELMGGQGYISDPAKFYSILSVYVQPTVTEGFGLTCLEAMSYGRPVIVTEGAGVMELIEDGKDGFIVPIRDPEKIAEKIEYFYNSPSEVKRMGHNAREKATKYTWRKVREEYQKLFR